MVLVVIKVYDDDLFLVSSPFQRLGEVGPYIETSKDSED